ncbi:hypothetical protein KKI17_01675 [Patescibacteria group bacterium]|nr:hypothetical protein [Patescibacteria group bacterium]
MDSCKELAQGRWHTFSLAEQLANIGSEVGRARKWQIRDAEHFWNAVERTLELFNLTLADKRWAGRKKEIARLKAVFCDAVLGGEEYKSSLGELEAYFFPFMLVSRK